MGPIGEDRKTIEMEEEGGDENISGGKAVPVALMKAGSERRRQDEDQRGASGLPRRRPGGGELVLRP